MRAYQLKASGPLLDRLDFVLTLTSIGLKQEMPAETSEKIRIRTERAHLLQKNRYGGPSLNGTVAGSLLLAACGLTDRQNELLETVCFRKKWSNRTLVKLIRLARTISDLEGVSYITEASIEEAIHWKQMADLHQEAQRIHGTF